MPELPDLEYLRKRLGQALVGKQVVEAEAVNPVLFRTLDTRPVTEAIVGQTLVSVWRKGAFLSFDFDSGARLVVNAMLAGRYKVGGGTPAGKPARKAGVAKGGAGSLGMTLTFGDGTWLAYLDSKQMGKIYWVARGREDDVPTWSSLGVDVMSDGFSADVFLQLISKRRDQVRQFLMDKSALSAIGNAYADEILFAAGVHPKTFCSKLSKDDKVRLFHAVRSTLTAACEEIERRQPRIEDKLRDFLKVRGRVGRPCPTCQTKIRQVRVGAGDANFCPKCQPAARALFIDWSKVNK